MSTNIFLRLREERERLGKTQEEFAAIAGVTRRPYAEWERPEGKTSPTAQSLFALAQVGADVLYILTGQRSQALAPQELLPEDERIMLDNYRHAPDAVRAGVKRRLAHSRLSRPSAQAARKPPDAANDAQWLWVLVLNDEPSWWPWESAPEPAHATHAWGWLDAWLPDWLWGSHSQHRAGMQTVMGA